MLRRLGQAASVTLAVLVFTATGCKTHSVDRDVFLQGDSYESEYPYRKILLVGLDADTRTRLENDIEGRLTSGGTQVVGSHETWKTVADIERERELEVFVEKYEIEAVVTIGLLDAAQAESVDLAAAGSTGVVSAMEAGLASAPAGDFVVEVVVWNARDFVPIWVAHSEVFPEKLRNKSDEFADFVVEVLQDRELVRFQRGTR
jgi:hypothetical protein